MQDDFTNEENLKELPAEVQQGLDFLMTIVGHMGFVITEYHIEAGEESYTISLSSDNEAMIIGKKGSVLNSMQFLLASYSSKIKSPYMMYLDVGGYRKKQEQFLQQEVRYAIDRINDSHKPFLLKGPYSPIERRSIHIFIKNYPSLTSYSEGQGFLKSVWIAFSS